MGKPKSDLITMGRNEKWTHGLANTPVTRGSTRLFHTYEALRAGVSKAFARDEIFYGRMGTPSQWSLEDTISELEGAHGTYLYPSGMAAIAGTILSLVKAGEHILLPDSVYEPVRIFAAHTLKGFDVEVEYYDPLLASALENLMRKNTSLVMVESPGSLTFEVQDVAAIAAICKAHNAYLIADNTWATPLYHNPLALGADVSIHAATKYLGGHGDLMMGSASTNARTWHKLHRGSFNCGLRVSADDAFLALRGLRTLAPRLEAHQKTAVSLAKWLDGHPAVARVLHPALPDCPGHEIWRRDFRGSSGLFSIILKAGAKKSEPSDVAPMVDHMKFFHMGFSWGGFESLILPAEPSKIRTATEWDAPGPLLRIHAGLEDIDDLQEDLDLGLKRYMDWVGL